MGFKSMESFKATPYSLDRTIFCCFQRRTSFTSMTSITLFLPKPTSFFQGTPRRVALQPSLPIFQAISAMMFLTEGGLASSLLLTQACKNVSYRRFGKLEERPNHTR